MGSPSSPGPQDKHISEVVESELAIQHLETERARLRSRSLGAIGILQDAPFSMQPIRREVAGTTGRWWYPIVSLGILAAVFNFPLWALFVLGPQISGMLGVSVGTLALINTMTLLLLSPALLAVAAIVHQRSNRSVVVIVGAAVYSVLLALTSFVTSTWGLFGTVLGASSASATGGAVHRSLLADDYPPGTRARIFAWYRSAQALGIVLAAVLFALCTGPLGLTWRFSFLVAGGVGLVATGLASRLRDPGYGPLDTDRIRALVVADEADDSPIRSEPDRTTKYADLFRQLLSTPTFIKVLVGYIIVGMMTAPLRTYLAFFLQQRWHMDVAQRSVFIASTLSLGVLAIPVISRYGERIFARDPGRLLRLGGWALLVAAAAVGVGSAIPVVGVMALLVAVSGALLLAVPVVLDLVSMSIVRSTARPHAAAATEIASVVLGGLLGTVLLSSIQPRFGYVPAFLLLLMPGWIGFGPRVTLSRRISRR